MNGTQKTMGTKHLKKEIKKGGEPAKKTKKGSKK